MAFWNRTNVAEPLKPVEPHHFGIDLCSVYRGMLAVDGWSSCGTPIVLYRGQAVPVRAYRSDRPDLTEAYGIQAKEWGFNLRALLGGGQVSHGDISLIFHNGVRVDAPGLATRPNNDNLDRMLARFRQASEAGGRALEIGSRARSGNTYRSLIADKVQYVGLDIADGPNVNIVGDAHHLSRHTTDKFDYVFSISVFEHLLMPWKVALEMNKVMNAGALAFIQSHPAYPLHEEPWDFWRYSENAWEGIFNKHTGFRVLDKGYALGARIVPDYATGDHLEGLDSARTHLLSACLVEKVAEPLVSWEAEAGDLYDLNYDHA